MLTSRTDYYRVISDSFGGVVPGTREARKTVYDEMRRAVREQSKLQPHRFDFAAEQRALEKAILDVEISAKRGEPIPRTMPSAEAKPLSAPRPAAGQDSAPPARPAMPHLKSEPSPSPQPLASVPYGAPDARAYVRLPQEPPTARPATPQFHPAFLNRPDRVSYARRADPPPPSPKPKPQSRQAPPQQQRAPAPQWVSEPQEFPQEHGQQRVEPEAASPPPRASRQADDVNILDSAQSRKTRKVYLPRDMPEEKPRSAARIIFIVLLAATIGGAAYYFATPEQWIAKLVEFGRPGPTTEPTAKTFPTGAAVTFGEQRAPTPQEMVAVAIQQSSQREYGRALATLDDARSKGAAGAEFYSARAYANWGSGDVQSAIADYTEAIRLDPGNGANYTHRAVAYNARGEYMLSIRDLERAIAIEPNNPDNWNSRCWARTLAGQLQEAIVDCNESLRLRPNDPNTLDSRGFAHLKAGQNSRAIADYNVALKADPKLASSIYGRGIARLRSGDRTAAYTDIAEAKAINPDIDAQFTKFGVR